MKCSLPVNGSLGYRWRKAEEFEMSLLSHPFTIIDSGEETLAIFTFKVKAALRHFAHNFASVLRHFAGCWILHLTKAFDNNFLQVSKS